MTVNDHVITEIEAEQARLRKENERLRRQVAKSGSLQKYDALRQAITRFLDSETRSSHCGISYAHERNLAFNEVRRLVDYRIPWCPCSSCERKRESSARSG